MSKDSPFILALFWACILFSVPPMQAHEEFEITSTARLQHNRLEVAAIMTIHAAGALLEEGGDPEFELRPANFELYRGRLQTAAMGFYEITAGGEPLVPLQASVTLPEPGHLRFTVIYPQPASWPLKFRPGKVSGMPASAINDLGVYDQGEKLLGTTVMPLRDSARAGLSVDPASTVPASPAVLPPASALPTITAVDVPPVAPANVSPSPKPQSWMDIAFVLAVGLATLTLVVLIKKDKTSPTL